MPVTLAFFAALERLGPFGRAPRLAVAVSGGADSTALALLANNWVKNRNGSVVALIVDHGLRAESAAEAVVTAARLGERGIRSRVLTLTGLPHGAKLQEAARSARYQALAAAARDENTLFILLGHHAADQAETVAMRAIRGPGGAEGMAAWAARDDVLLLRPMLGMAPGALRDYLRAEGMAWIEDPSNENRKFERVRVRQDGAGLAPHGAAARVAREQEVAAFLARHVSLRPEGFAVLDAGGVPVAALGALLRVVGGADYAPGREAVAPLAAALRPATLGGVRISPAGRLGEGWLLTREAAACAAPVPARRGVVWDRRFRLTVSPTAGASLGALGDDAKNYRKFNNLPAAVLRTMACLRDEDGDVTFPVPVVFSPPAPVTAYPFFS